MNCHENLSYSQLVVSISLLWKHPNHISSSVQFFYHSLFFFVFSLVSRFSSPIFTHRNGHMLTHRNKKPYECKAEGCGKSYCDARSLRRHTENHHSTVATAPTTPNQSISSTGPLGGLSLSPATASGKCSILIIFMIHWKSQGVVGSPLFCCCCCSINDFGPLCWILLYFSPLIIECHR